MSRKERREARERQMLEALSAHEFSALLDSLGGGRWEDVPGFSPMTSAAYEVARDLIPRLSTQSTGVFPTVAGGVRFQRITTKAVVHLTILADGRIVWGRSYHSDHDYEGNQFDE